MNKDNEVPYIIFKDVLNKAHKLQDDVDYFGVAMEYVLEKDPNIYNTALEYADKLKENDWLTDDDKKRFNIK